VSRLDGECSLLVCRRDLLLKRLQQNAASQRYLVSVVEAAEDFHEIREILARYDTLISTQQVAALFAAYQLTYTVVFLFLVHCDVYVLWTDVSTYS